MRKKNKAAVITLFVFFVSCEEVLEPSLQNQKVVPLAPIDNAVSVNSSQTFYWEQMQGASKYQLQIVSPRFDSIVQLISDTNVLTNQFMFSMPKGIFQWRVRAVNASTISNYSDPRKIIIQ